MTKTDTSKLCAKRSLLSCVLALAICSLVVVTAARWSRPVPAHAQNPQTVNCAQWQSSTGPFPPVPNTIDSTCAAIPADFQGTPAQSNFDLYSWITFIAMNWPAEQGCVADTSQSILTAAPNPVWMTYLQDSDVFVPVGKQPASWCFGSTSAAAAKGSAGLAKKHLTGERSFRLAHLPPRVRALAAKHPEVRLFLHYSSKATNRSRIKTLATGAKADGSLPEVLQATGDILVDQNGRWARFSVAMDQDEYKYIKSKTLWTKAGQQNAGAISFPWSPLGAMEFKAAWKVLGTNDDPSHFFTMQAIVYNDLSGDPSPGPNPVTVGLVGLHITHKTNHQRNWIWSTFEQVENDTKSFYNPNCPVSQCPPNTKTVSDPTTAQELNAQGEPKYRPTQVVPITPASAQSLNSNFQGLLKGTPWAYYQLISTQWTGEAGTAPKPPQLGNSVQETFVPSGSFYGCINCHTGARAWGNQKADFSWMLHFGPRQ